MPKISMWSPTKNNDYTYSDNISAENLRIGGVGILVHKYIGPPGGDGIEDIDDLLFLENRNRSYNDNVIETRGLYTPTDVDYDLSQFGIFLSSDVIRIDFHYNDILDQIGRKIIAGDVLEFPNQRDITLSGVAINKYYVVQDALYSSSGYGQTWYPHLWKVRAKQMTASEEFSDILDNAGTGATAGGVGAGIGIMPPGYTDMIDEDGNPGPGCNPTIRNAMDLYCKFIDITDGIIEEAEENVKFDPKFFCTKHLYVQMDENNYPVLLYWRSGDGEPPNGAPLNGMGTSFPDDMKDGEYFLRTDYQPDRLFQKQGACFAKIEDDIIKVWTAYNKVLDTFIDNVEITEYEDGTTARVKQPLSKVIPAKKDMYTSEAIALEIQEAKRKALAKKLDGAE